MHQTYKDLRVRGEWFRLDEVTVDLLASLQYVYTKADIPEAVRDRNCRLTPEEVAAVRRNGNKRNKKYMI